MSSQYNDQSGSETNASDYSDLEQYYQFRPPIHECEPTVKQTYAERRFFNENRRFNTNIGERPFRNDYDNLSGRVPLRVSNCPGEQMYQIRNERGQSEENLERARMRIENTYPKLRDSQYGSGYFNFASAYGDR
jgi:hypothetical protein